MKPHDWIAIAAITATLVAGAFAGWVKNETRLSGLERDLKALETTQRVVRKIAVDTVRELYELKGQHMPHVEGSEHEHPQPMSDEPVQAHSWLLGAEM